jgi:hypothetical protein
MPFVRMSFAIVTSHLDMTNCLAYLAGATMKNKRAFLGLAARRVLNQCCPLPNAIKPFTVVNLQCSLEAGVLVPGRPFEICLMFVGKASSLG